ncbi:MarR family transcriptional regulator [Konateibacter massiliensis]|uniref:MarR family transcriptional regulator n=1 Tax=Konateibacter massiliensis TaxID=2002841 RepID=UPI000C14FDE7|nr:MarR family transcriptional regulator [Konateibacter massiliensis]
MYTQEEKNAFVNVAESLKKYRRADLIDESGKSILDKLYVDLLPSDVVLNKCLLDNTTFLVGRKGTGKSTIFLKLENEYRKKTQYLPCYVDVKTIYESSQAQAINQQYLSQYFDENNLNKYLISRNFIQSVLKRIYEEIDEQRQTILSKVAGVLTGNSNEEIKNRISELRKKIDDNEIFKSIEIPVLQQKSVKKSNGNKEAIQDAEKSNMGVSVSMSKMEAKGEVGSSSSIASENSNSTETEYTDILLKVFEIKHIISEVKNILKSMKITKLIIMLDDISEIETTSLRSFIDTIVAPLNNWSDEFIKFKVAFYPSRVHYGMIDPGKIDIIHLDFYELYSEFDANKMEENAIDFTKRLLDNRFEYFTKGFGKYFDDKQSFNDIYATFFRVSMNVPRIIGYILSYLYQSVIIYNKKITRQDIENISEKYYEEKIDAFFKSSTYCLMSIDEKRDIEQLKKIRDAIVSKAKDIKSQIVKGELEGKLYLKNLPYSSHFHILQETDKYLDSLELNYFITKYEERSNRDGKKVNIYCLNYGLAKKNNILWGKPSGNESRTYFIERPFNYTNLVLEQIKEVKVIRCTNQTCARVFDESELDGLKFTGFKCPNCHSEVKIESRIDSDVERDMNISNQLPLVNKEELLIILELCTREQFSPAKDIAGEVDINSYRLSKIFKKLDEEKGVVIRKMDVNPYEYKISDLGKGYVVE